MARLLVVDDKDSIRVVLETQLARLGHAVELAPDVESAVRALACLRSASTSSSNVAAREPRSPSTSPSATSALVATSVAVSKARITIVLNRDKPEIAAAVLEPHGRTHRREHAGAGLGPLDEDHRILEIRLQVTPLRRRDVAEAEEVEVRHVDAPPVPVTDREGGAGDRARHTEGTARTADKGRLPRAELPRDRDDIPRRQPVRELRRELFGLLRRVRLGQKRPSWTAGSAVTAVRKTGSGGGATYYCCPKSGWSWDGGRDGGLYFWKCCLSIPTVFLLRIQNRSNGLSILCSIEA